MAEDQQHVGLFTPDQSYFTDAAPTQEMVNSYVSIYSGYSLEMQHLVFKKVPHTNTLLSNFHSTHTPPTT